MLALSCKLLVLACECAPVSQLCIWCVFVWLCVFLGPCIYFHSYHLNKSRSIQPTLPAILFCSSVCQHEYSIVNCAWISREMNGLRKTIHSGSLQEMLKGMPIFKWEWYIRPTNRIMGSLYCASHIALASEEWRRNYVEIMFVPNNLHSKKKKKKILPTEVNNHFTTFHKKPENERLTRNFSFFHRLS